MPVLWAESQACGGVAAWTATRCKGGNVVWLLANVAVHAGPALQVKHKLVNPAADVIDVLMYSVAHASSLQACAPLARAPCD